MKELLGDEYVLENQGNEVANANIKRNQPNFINLDDFSKSNKGNPQSNFCEFYEHSFNIYKSIFDNSNNSQEHGCKVERVKCFHPNA
jgi:hypothetical protein